MELTQEVFERTLEKKFSSFEQILDKKLSKFATKDDLDNAISKSEKRIIARIDQSQEELALITKSGFDEVLEKIEEIDVRPRVKILEIQMGEIRNALQLN